jgi:hypothetical protein
MKQASMYLAATKLRTIKQAFIEEPALGSEVALRQSLHRGIYPYYKVTPSRNGRVLVGLNEIREILVARRREA